MVTTFTYNGDGARVRVSVNGVITTYVGTTYETVTTTGVTTYYYLGSQRVAMRTSSGVTWLQGDHLGSASLTTNSGGARVSEERYYPYGATRVVTGTMATEYQFTGQKNDGGTGLYFYNARYYDPVSGRFSSADPVPPKPGRPQSRNRYAYVYNNPVRYVDPSGLLACGNADELDCDINQGLKNQWYNAHGIYMWADGDWSRKGDPFLDRRANFAHAIINEGGLVLSAERGGWTSGDKGSLAAGVAKYGVALTKGIGGLRQRKGGVTTVSVGSSPDVCGGRSCAPPNERNRVYFTGIWNSETVVHELAHVIDWNNPLLPLPVWLPFNPTLSSIWLYPPLTAYAQNAETAPFFAWEPWAEAVTLFVAPSYSAMSSVLPGISQKMYDQQMDSVRRWLEGEY